MKGAGDAKWNGFPPSAFGQLAHPIERIRLARNHDLSGAVEVGRHDDAGVARLAADADDLLVGQADDREHAAGIALSGVLHDLSPAADQSDRRLEVERPRGDPGAELTQAVAGDHLRSDSAAVQRGQPGDTRRQQGGLGDIRAGQQLVISAGADVDEVESQHLAGLVEECASGRLAVQQLGGHTDLLRRLPREHERAAAGLGAHHRSTIDAQLSPAPKLDRRT